LHGEHLGNRLHPGGSALHYTPHCQPLLSGELLEDCLQAGSLSHPLLHEEHLGDPLFTTELVVNFVLLPSVLS